MPDSTKMSLKYFLQSFMTRGFVSEIFYAYTGLKRSYNTQLSNGFSESRLLAYSFFISLVLFLHRLPDKLTHNQKFNTKVSLNDQIGIDLFASLFFVPIFLYIIAFFIHLLWLPFGSKATYFETRLAFFWATIISSPVLLSLSLIEGIYHSSWLSWILNFFSVVFYSWIFSSILCAAHKIQSNLYLFFLLIIIYLIFSYLNIR